jgi:hypothetical protein
MRLSQRCINMKTSQQLATRVNPANPDHHLWNNHGTWWCHFTVHLADFTKQRIRRSLNTNDVTQARQIRDFLFATLPGGDVLA